MSEKKTHGGRRQGSGRKPFRPELKKVQVGIKLPQWLIDWSGSQEKSRAELIEHALVKQYGLEPPAGEEATTLSGV